ncbi:MAG: hypothetical protein H7319_19065 [Spirosoma sp.]|nr:hypothetical protein [Spirosoma sp.]
MDDSVWAMYNTDGIYDTEYRPDGTLIYRKDGVVQPAQCCAPTQFKRNGNVIQYTESLPCSLVFCDFTGNPTIRILREDLLELESNNVITQYTPIK